MRKNHKQLWAGALSLLFALLFVLVMCFATKDARHVPMASGEIKQQNMVYDENGKPTLVYDIKTIGEDVAAVRINDLTKIGALTTVNYTPNEFVQPTSFSENSQIVDLTKEFHFAKKGTLTFVILTLDPFAEDFSAQSKALEPYRRGDNWQFSLLLPSVFSAVNVYQKTALFDSVGSIKNYHFIEFTTSDAHFTETHATKTEPLQIPLTFYTRRQMMESFTSSQIITIHYQSNGGVFSGINGLPLIGAEDVVGVVNRQSRSVLAAAAILSAIVFAVLVTLSILKRTNAFFSELLAIVGALGIFLSKYTTLTSTRLPYFWAATGTAAPFLLLGATVFSIGKRIKKFPLKGILLALSAVGILLAFLQPYLSLGLGQAVTITIILLKALLLLGLLSFVLLNALGKNSDEFFPLKAVSAGLIIVLTATTLLLPPSAFVLQYPPLWLYAAVIVVDFIIVFKIFTDTERENAYMTANLNLEVERQTQDIRAVIDERDKLLQFLSHDMKKPLSSAASFLSVLIAREKDEEQIKTLHIVKQSTDKVISNLTEIASYAHYNYVAEPSCTLDIAEAVQTVYKYSVADCEANGILLRNLVSKKTKVFAKRQGLENALTNIIFNAVEHADCSEIELSVQQDRNKVLLLVTDDGKGVDPDLNVFKPYVSENAADSSGLGLYICKSLIEAMNGTLTHYQKDGKTVFAITLLKA